jgi:hypothetical protein
MIEEGFPAKRIVVMGQPYLEACHYVSVNSGSGSRFSERTLLVTQPVSRHFGRSLGYDETDFIDGALLAWRESARDWRQLHLIVHPDEDRQLYRRKLDSYSTSIRIIDNNDLNLSNFSLMVGMYSSLMIRAMLAEVAVVSFQPNASGSDVCHLSAQGLTKRLTTVEQLTKFLAAVDSTSPRVNLVTSFPFLTAIKGSCDRLEQFLLS